MAPTCLEAVRGLMKSVSAISRSVRPAASSPKHLGLAGAQALGTGMSRQPRILGRSGRGSRTPSARRRRVACARAGFAPSSSKIAIARRTRSGSSLSARAHASSYGQPSSSPGRGRPSEVAGDLQGIRLGQVVGRNVPLAGLPQQPGELAPLPAIASRRRRGHAPPALLPARARCPPARGPLRRARRGPAPGAAVYRCARPAPAPRRASPRPRDCHGERTPGPTSSAPSSASPTITSAAGEAGGSPSLPRPSCPDGRGGPLASPGDTHGGSRDRARSRRRCR